MANKILNGLPAKAYTDKDFWDRECKNVFANNWVFVGFAHELKNIGDVIPIKVAEQPILLVKNTKQKIVAYHNVCSHRCLILVDERRNFKKIINCPYHAWSYDLDGNLINSPHFGGTNNHVPKGFDKKKNGLKSIRIKIWHDWIFININKNALPFEKYAAKLIKQLKNINLKNIKPVATLNFGNISTNWKFLIENFIEPYHVQFVHKKTTSQPLKDHYTIVDGNCYGSGVDLKNEDASGGSLAVSSKYLSLFPNFIIGTYYPGQLGVYLNSPINLSTTSQKRIIYTTKGYNLNKSEIDNQKNLWWKVHKEDHHICERLQLGRSSPVSQKGGLLSPYWENSVRAFHQIMVNSMKKK
tara:strand:+ start:74 stop:1138 length:1065 start_codon:yes stop_codon:yes gene_type:complete